MNVRVLSLERNDKKCPKKPTKQKQSKTKQKLTASHVATCWEG